MGKSLGDGIYNSAASDEDELQFIYTWMWEHLRCKEGELSKGELFKVLSEYDDRIRYDNVVGAPLPQTKWACPVCHTSFSQFREGSFPPCPMCQAREINR